MIIQGLTATNDVSRNFPNFSALVHPHDSWNPVDCQLTVWRGIIAKTRLCKNWVDKVLCFVLPPGWNPETPGVEYPLVDSTPYSALKYDSHLPWTLTCYLVTWFTFALSLGILLVRSVNQMTLLGTSLLFAYVFFSLFSLGALSDRNPRSVVYEFIRLAHTPFAVYVLGHYFGYANDTVLNSTLMTAVLCATSAFMLIAHGQLFIVESAAQRSQRVWIREAGRAFTQLLTDNTRTATSNGAPKSPAPKSPTKPAAAPKSPQGGRRVKRS